MVLLWDRWRTSTTPISQLHIRNQIQIRKQILLVKHRNKFKQNGELWIGKENVRAICSKWVLCPLKEKDHVSLFLSHPTVSSPSKFKRGQGILMQLYCFQISHHYLQCTDSLPWNRNHMIFTLLFCLTQLHSRRKPQRTKLNTNIHFYNFLL